MTYSLQQAADAAGVNKSTILRAIQAGKVSTTPNGSSSRLSFIGFTRQPLRATGNSKVMATVRTSPNSLKSPDAPPSRS
jgi:hypothetical protein